MATRIIIQMAKSVCHMGGGYIGWLSLEVRLSAVRSTGSSASPVEIPFLRLAI